MKTCSNPEVQRGPCAHNGPDLAPRRRGRWRAWVGASAIGLAGFLPAMNCHGEITIFAQPVDAVLLAGQEAYFEVGVTATEDVTYQWLRNGAPLNGETRLTLTIPRVEVQHLGYYSVQVSSATETVTTREARLTLSNRPSGMVRFAASGILDSDKVTPLLGTNFLAQLHAGPTPAHLAPLGTPVPFPGTGTGSGGRIDGGTLSIPTVAPSSNAFAQILVWDLRAGATYTMASTNGKYGASAVVPFIAGTSSGTTPNFAAFALLEAGPPKIASQPGPSVVTVPTGGTAEYQAVVSGTAPVTLRWYSPLSRIVATDTNRLVLQDVRTTDTGPYYLEASNHLGVVWSESVYLSVYPTNMVPGSRDVSFGIGQGPDNSVRDVVEQPDGRILVGGDFQRFDGQTAPYLARIHRDGTVDLSFRSGASGPVQQLGLDALGRIYLVARPVGGSASAVQRLLPNGAEDPSFKRVSPTPHVNAVSYLGVVPETGEFYLYGDTSSQAGSGSLLKYSASGEPDPDFVTVRIGLNATTLEPVSIISLPDGSVLLAGNRSRRFTLSGETAQRSIVRFDPKGQVRGDFPNLDAVWLVRAPMTEEIIALGGSSGRVYRISPAGITADLGTINGLTIPDQTYWQPNGKVVAASYAFTPRFDIYYFVGQSRPGGNLNLVASWPAVNGTTRIRLLHDGRILALDPGRSGASAVTVYFGDPEPVAPFVRGLRVSVLGTSTLTFDSQTESLYRIEEGTDLGTWTEVARHTATSGVSRVTVPKGSAGKGFYRVVLDREPSR